jgi:hypothetical protein
VSCSLPVVLAGIVGENDARSDLDSVRWERGGKNLWKIFWFKW